MATVQRNARNNQTLQLVIETALIRVLPKLLGDATVLVGKVRMPADAIVAALRTHVAAIGAQREAFAAYRRAVAARKLADRPAKAILVAVPLYVSGIYGERSNQFAALGMPLPKRRKPSVATLVAAARKGHDTRKARRTMGKRQRAALERAKR